MSTTIMKNFTFIIFIVSQKIATLKFLPHTKCSAGRRAGRPNADHYILTFFMRAKKTATVFLRPSLHSKP